ncbi:MAG: hypothetical protein K9G76_02040 [Bacteroidales bacterium]|nr:hypothetical protein [Bacteroidales bacterium]MCF8405664.1 hypothetical protein [Bacteroidales bacterium]
MGSNIKSYLLSGKLLHIITILEILLIIYTFPLLTKIDTGNNMIFFVAKYYAIVFIISLPVFSQLDARSRYQNYKQIKDQLFQYGFDTRIFSPIIKSRCQRDAAHLASHELGLGKLCKNYFTQNGYRWYNLLPDYVFNKPQFLATEYFWKTTFFAKTYRAKYDYSDPGVFNKNNMVYG